MTLLLIHHLKAQKTIVFDLLSVCFIIILVLLNFLTTLVHRSFEHYVLLLEYITSLTLFRLGFLIYSAGGILTEKDVIVTLVDIDRIMAWNALLFSQRILARL